MAEEIVDVFSAIQSMPEEHGFFTRSCTLFLTNSRVIVMEPRGIDTRTFAVPIIALAVGFAGLLIMNLVLFFIGLGVGLVAGLVLGLANIFIRSRRISKAGKLAPDEILKADVRNFEILYSKTAKVEIERFEAFRKGSLFLPSLPQYKCAVKFFEENGRHVFILDSDVLNQFVRSIEPYVSEIVETEEK